MLSAVTVPVAANNLHPNAGLAALKTEKSPMATKKNLHMLSLIMSVSLEDAFKICLSLSSRYYALV